MTSRKLLHEAMEWLLSGPGDERLIVLFYNKSILNAARSKAEGKRIFESREFIKIQQPGETINIVDRPVQEEDKTEIPKAMGQVCTGQEPNSGWYPDFPLVSGTSAISPTCLPVIKSILLNNWQIFQVMQSQR